MTRSFGLRAALIMLVLIAIAPVFAVVVQASLEERRGGVRRAQENLAALVDLGAAHQQRLIDGARQMLTAIANSPPVFEDDEAACVRYMQKLQSQRPVAGGTFGVIDMQGRLTCRAEPPPRLVNSSDRLFFRRAIETGRFSVGEFTISRASGRPVLTFGLPMYRDAGLSLRGVVYLALDVAEAHEQWRGLTVSPGMTLTVADANAVALASAGSRPAQVGERLPEEFMRRAIAKGEAWQGRVHGADGREWLFHLRPVGLVDERQLFVAGTASLDELLAPAAERLRAQLAALALITLLAVGLAWTFADHVVLEPMRQLLRRVDLLAREDQRLDQLPERARVRELGELNIRFHEMARRLAERSVQRDGAMAEMAHQNTLIESVLGSMAEGVLVVDRRGRLMHTNDAAQRILGGVRQLNQGNRLAILQPQDWGVFLLDGVTPCDAEQWPVRLALQGQGVENFRYLVRGRLSAGEEKIIQGSARPVHTPDGRPAGAVVAFSDATASWHAEQALVASEQRYRSLFQANPHSMWVLGEQALRFLTVNDAAIVHYGYSREEFISMTMADILCPPGEVEAFNAFLHQERPIVPARTWQHRLRSGRTIEVEISSHTLDYGGQPARLVLALDVTSRRQAEEALRLLNENLERRVEERTRDLLLANQELESFSYSVSHDLRAPLQVIDGFSRTLAARHGERLDDQGRHYLNRIRDNTQRMSDLIDDLLSLARVSRVEIQAESLDLGAMVAQEVERLRQRFPDRKVEVSIEEGLRGEGDARLLAVVLQNLLENAWKFTAKTEVAQVRVGQRPGPRGEPVFCVADNGAGFDMAYAGKLFTPFQRLHASSEFEGTGIGLATVRRIVSRHGGRVWAEGTPGRGAAFLFTLGPVAT